MRTVLLTTPGLQFGSVFFRALRESYARRLDHLLVLPDRHDLGFGLRDNVSFLWRVLGVQGTVKVLAERYCAWVLPLELRRKGVGRSWMTATRETFDEVTAVRSLDSEAIRAAVKAARPDLIISIGVPVILPPAVLEIATVGALNVHNGRVPRYRGHFASFWEIIEGEKIATASIHTMATKVDSGKVLAKVEFPLQSVRSFYDLLVEKKQRAGIALGHLLRETEDGGKLPVRDLSLEEDRAGSRYYGFPTGKDLGRFVWPSQRPGLSSAGPQG